MTTGRTDRDGMGANGWAAASCRVLEVRGSDATTYLQGQLSQDIEAVAIGQSALSMVLEPDGKLGFLIRLARLDEQTYLFLGDQGERLDDLRRRLERFRLRSDVAVSVDERTLILLGPSARPPADGVALVPLSAASAVLEVLAERVPDDLEPSERFDAEDAALLMAQAGQVTPEDVAAGDNPASLGAALTASAASFTKGCYTGQELVARVHARAAEPPFRFAAAHATGAVVRGAPFEVDGVTAGEMRSGLTDPTDGSWYGCAMVARRISLEEPVRAVSGGHHVVLRAL